MAFVGQLRKIVGWERVIAVGIKKFVAIVLVVSIVSLVPLQTLAQVEPQITYDEWCTHLSELYSRLESTPQTNEQIFMLSMVAILVGTTVAQIALMVPPTPDSLAICELAALIGLGGCLGFILSMPLYLLIDPRYKIRVEIAKWKALGEPYFWFYPCE